MTIFYKLVLLLLIKHEYRQYEERTIQRKRMAEWPFYKI